MKRIAILGSTGSIGTSALEIVQAFPEEFEVVALAAGDNLDRLAAQVTQVHPRLVSIADPARLPELRDRLVAAGVDLDSLELVAGPEGPLAVVGEPAVEVVLTAMVGVAGLRPTLAAIDRGIEVALANKEPLVAAGHLCTARARRSGATLLPVDSEHSAIFQCLLGQATEALAKIILTCSGGPFREVSDLSTVTRAQALAHPTWSMGAKISVDSATLMNKGLEVIEARWLFDVAATKIDVVIHPESVVHSLVELVDGSLLAQLGTPDMRLPIAFALAYPRRLPLRDPPLGASSLDLIDRAPLTFAAPDRARFPALDLAYGALVAGGTAPAVLSAANEIAVAAFLVGRIPFLRIVEVVAETLGAHEVAPAGDIESVLAADSWARAFAEACCR